MVVHLPVEAFGGLTLLSLGFGGRHFALLEASSKIWAEMLIMSNHNLRCFLCRTGKCIEVFSSNTPP